MSKKISLALLILILSVCFLPTVASAASSDFTIVDGELVAFTGEDSSVTIPDDVTIIGKLSFDSAENIKSVTIPDGVTGIESYAFINCFNLENISISSSVTKIENSAFQSCTGLREVTIPNGVRSIGNLAFFGCTSLTKIAIPESVTNIAEDAFKDCENLTIYAVKGSTGEKFAAKHNIRLVCQQNFEIKDGVLVSYTGTGGNVIIPDSVTEIGAYAFYNCSNLTVVTIPDSVTTIGEGAFYGCFRLKTVNMPGKLNYIGDMAFYSCETLDSITIPDTVTYIGSGGFYCCSNIVEITLPAGISYIGENAFGDCPNITIYGTGGSKAESYATSNNISFIVLKDEPSNKGFTDVNESDYFADAVKWAVGRGITNGTTDSSFSPYNQCTNAQVITLLYRAAGSPETSGSVSISGVTESDYYYNAVLWAYKKSIIDNSFDPDDYCICGMAVNYLYRYANGGTNRSYEKAVKWATNNGIITDNEEFSQEDICSRAQIVTFLYRWFAGKSATLGIEEISDDSVKAKLESLLERNVETTMFDVNYTETVEYEDYPTDIDLSWETKDGGIPYLLQWDTRWGYCRYGDGLIGYTGCGPTAMSMVLIGLTGDTKYNPAYVAKFAIDKGYCVYGSGTAWSFFSSGAEKLGLKSKSLKISKSVMEKELDAGHPIVCVMGPGDFASSGHYIVISGYNENGFTVLDPNNKSNTAKTWKYTTIESQIKSMWSLSN